MTLQLVRTEADRLSIDPLPTRRSQRELAQSQAIPVVSTTLEAAPVDDQPVDAPLLAAPPVAAPPVETRATRRARLVREALATTADEPPVLDMPAVDSSAPTTVTPETVLLDVAVLDVAVLDVAVLDVPLADVPVVDVPLAVDLPVVDLPVVDGPTAPTTAARAVAPARGTSLHAWIPRTAVVAALALSTIALPTTGALSAIKGSAVKDLVVTGAVASTTAAASDVVGGDGLGPTTLAIISGATDSARTPKILAQAVSSDERLAAAASRSETRSSLVSCAGGTASGGNGSLDRSELCTLPQGSFELQPDAAIAFSEMSDAFEARFGQPIRVASAYRSFGEQASLRSTKPGLAAAPGTSNHGWGYAIDLASSSYKSATQWQWLLDNASSFGWVNPDWAKGAKYEPWHWEYVTGVSRVGGTL